MSQETPLSLLTKLAVAKGNSAKSAGTTALESETIKALEDALRVIDGRSAEVRKHFTYFFDRLKVTSIDCLLRVINVEVQELYWPGRPTEKAMFVPWSEGPDTYNLAKLVTDTLNLLEFWEVTVKVARSSFKTHEQEEWERTAN